MVDGQELVGIGDGLPRFPLGIAPQADADAEAAQEGGEFPLAQAPAAAALGELFPDGVAGIFRPGVVMPGALGVQGDAVFSRLGHAPAPFPFLFIFVHYNPPPHGCQGESP